MMCGGQWHLLLVAIIAATYSVGKAAEPAGTNRSVVLLQDGFGDLRPGLFSSVVGAHTEYHYLPEASAKGNWAVSTFRSGTETQRDWRVVEVDGAAAMQQASTNSEAEYHPMLVAGDSHWDDYRLTVEFTPESADDQSGIVFRYRNDRCYYFLGVDGPKAVLKMVRHATGFGQPNEKVLASEPFDWPPGQRLRGTVNVQGKSIHAEITLPQPLPSRQGESSTREGKDPEQVTFDVEDDTFPRGKIGLSSDVPTYYHSVKVTTDAAAKARLDGAVAAQQTEEAELQAANPKMVVWRKIKTDGFGVGRNLRFGDLDGDGQIDVLIGQVRHHGPKDRNSELSCLTAMNFDGKILWQIGEPDPWHDHLTNDVAFQIHDIDGDGKNEVVYTMKMELIVVEGATGKTVRRTATPDLPENTAAPYNKFPRALGDAIYFCDLRGTGRDADLILKDRYLNVWAFDDRHRVMWHSQCNTGHFPYAEDIDGDGKDELMMGYTLFNHDGKNRWSLDKEIQDHADGVALVRFMPGKEYHLLCAASDEGMFFADVNGKILKHHYLGHVQNPATADFRPDMPGLESVSINFWGNQGIIHFFDAEGEVYHDFEPVQHGSMCLPINWTGKPGEFFVLSADVREGGLFDGWGRRVVKFPADGHPDQCNAVLDITGDGRDEIVVWDPYEIWVYTQADNPRPGKLYKPKRNPLYNYSNYQATVSLPGWSE